MLIFLNIVFVKEKRKQGKLVRIGANSHIEKQIL